MVSVTALTQVCGCTNTSRRPASQLGVSHISEFAKWNKHLPGVSCWQSYGKAQASAHDEAVGCLAAVPRFVVSVRGGLGVRVVQPAIGNEASPNSGAVVDYRASADSGVVENQEPPGADY